MDLLHVNAEVCIRCGQCVRSCARDLFLLDEDTVPFLPEDKEKRCTRCGHCAAACPVDAIRLLVTEGEDVTPIRKEFAVSFDQAAQLFKSCRSVRRFSDKTVPVKDIEEILQVARLAPTGGNNQLVRWIVLQPPPFCRRPHGRL